MKTRMCYVYRWGLGDTSNHGISSCYDKLFVVDPNGMFETDETAENLVRVVRDAIGDGCHVEPVNGHKGKEYTGWTFGGAYLLLDEKKEKFVRIHDRQDTWEAEAILSR